MGFNDQRYFYLGGGIAFGFFTFLMVLIGFSIVSPSKIEQFALTQSQYVSVSIDISPHKPSPKPVPVAEPQTPDSKPTPVEEVKQQAVESQNVPDISDLFSRVKPQKTVKKENDSAQKLEALTAFERQMSVRAQSTPRLAEKVKNTALVTPSVKIVASGGSSGPLVNEYHAKIQALIYANYYPPSGSQGQSARVKIYIDASGKLSAYRVIVYSGNDPFNREVDGLSDRLRGVVFPPHPEGKNTVLEIILTAKE